MALNLTVADHIAVITIDDPPLNLWRTETSEQLVEIFDSFMDDHDVRVAIITGAGERAFTAGQDLNEVRNAPPRPGAFRQARWYLQAMQDCPVPIIGAVNGIAVGHGIAICSGCDILIASENARFGVPEIKVGLANGHRMMMEFFPKSHARYAFFTGELIDAQEAYRVGAVLDLVSAEELMPTAREIAGKIARNSPIALRLFKDTVRWTPDMDLQKGYRFEGERSRSARQDPSFRAHAQEAQAAFREKRTPEFD